MGPALVEEAAAVAEGFFLEADFGDFFPPAAAKELVVRTGIDLESLDFNSGVLGPELLLL